MKPSILFVDDELHISKMTQEYLELKGYDIDLFHNAIDGMKAYKSTHYDLCLLDVKMPIKDGFTMAKEIRSLSAEVPIVFLTGNTEVEDRVKGLTIGADDYITKPYSMEELALRIQAILKRVYQQENHSEKKMGVGDYSFDPVIRELSIRGKSIKLSSIESRLLQLLCEHKNGLVKRDYALNRIWEDEDQLKGRSLNVYISKLRTYLKADARLEILNVHGEGYKLVVKNDENL